MKIAVASTYCVPFYVFFWLPSLFVHATVGLLAPVKTSNLMLSMYIIESQDIRLYMCLYTYLPVHACVRVGLRARMCTHARLWLCVPGRTSVIGDVRSNPSPKSHCNQECNCETCSNPFVPIPIHWSLTMTVVWLMSLVATG